MIYTARRHLESLSGGGSEVEAVPHRQEDNRGERVADALSKGNMKEVEQEMRG